MTEDEIDRPFIRAHGVVADDEFRQTLDSAVLIDGPLRILSWS